MKLVFELEVDSSFNRYDFFKVFKGLMGKKFFKGIISINRLENASEVVEADNILLNDIYGVK